MVFQKDSLLSLAINQSGGGGWGGEKTKTFQGVVLIYLALGINAITAREKKKKGGKNGPQT